MVEHEAAGAVGGRWTRPPLFSLLLTLALSLALGGARAVAAHDFWIEPSGFAPPAGGRISVKLRVGQQFEGDPMPRDPQRIVRFAALGPAGEAPIPGLPGTDPAGYLVPAAPGLYQLVYTSNHDSVELDAGKFEKYLADEGLDNVVALRAQRRESAAPAREIFSRCAKSLIAVGGAGGAARAGGHDQALGLPLELVADRNPYSPASPASPASASSASPPSSASRAALGAGMELPVTLLFRGRPLAGAKVTAIPKGHPADQVSARTDAKGKARLPLGRGGVWLIKSVHMLPAPAASGAQWESWWASLTFELPGR